MEIVFKASNLNIEGKLNNSDTAKKIFELLPLDSKVNTWGDEIYFEIPFSHKPENATEDVKVGDIAYWPKGECLCIFFGRTPISVDENPKPASEVNIVGKVTSDISFLKKIESGEKITVFKKNTGKRRLNYGYIG